MTKILIAGSSSDWLEDLNDWIEMETSYADKGVEFKTVKGDSGSVVKSVDVEKPDLVFVPVELYPLVNECKAEVCAFCSYAQAGETQKKGYPFVAADLDYSEQFLDAVLDKTASILEAKKAGKIVEVTPQTTEEPADEFDDDDEDDFDTTPEEKIRELKRQLMAFQKGQVPQQDAPLPEQSKQPVAQEPERQTDTVTGSLARKAAEEKEAVMAPHLRMQEQSAEQDISRMVNAGRKGKLIAVHSAKGGIGKTTVSAETGVLLSRVRSGLKRPKICLVDLDVDYSDVITRLIPFSGEDDENRYEKGMLLPWIDIIRERIRRGISPDNIRFTEGEIESYTRQLTLNGEPTDLFLLLSGHPKDNASITSVTPEEDGRVIDSYEVLNILLDNLINYGGFDYIICDTGNNTRDEAFAALEKADKILLVIAQDLTTVNDNIAFFDIVREYFPEGMMDKIYPVINRARGKSKTGLSVEDIADAIANAKTGIDPKHVWQLRESSEVAISGNEQIPCVTRYPECDFSRDLRKMISELLLQNESTFEEPEKKSFLQTLMARFKK